MNLFKSRISRINADKIPQGYDFLTTIRADQLIEIPSNFMGTGIDGFKQMVTFISAPLPSSMGNSDTIMHREKEIDLASSKKYVPTKLVAFSNVSAAPLKLMFKKKIFYYDLYITLSPTIDSPGKTIYTFSKSGLGGTFESEISLSPLFELRPLGRGESIIIDTGKFELPGFPMRLGSSGGRWTLKPPSERAVRFFDGVTLFYPDEVEIVAKSRDSVLVGCAKRQAEFISEQYRGQFARVNFPNPKPFGNIELR